LVRLHLAADGDHLILFIKQKQVAVAPHQLDYHLPFEAAPRPLSKTKLHNPLPRGLLQAHQG
jgi:hypothetical protein